MIPGTKHGIKILILCAVCVLTAAWIAWSAHQHHLPPGVDLVQGAPVS
jgi:hypothetical protein